MRGIRMHLCSRLSYSVSNLSRIKHQAIRTRRCNGCRIDLAEGDLRGTLGQHFGTSKVSKAPW